MRGVRGVVHRIRRARTPRCLATRNNSSNASASPETTTDAGPLIAATDTRPPANPAISSSTFAVGRATDTMPPRPASATIAWLRNATTRAPSARDNPPATTAAAISP